MQALVSGIVNNVLFHSNLHNHETLLQIIHTLHFWPVDSLQNYAPDFVVNSIKATVVHLPQI